MKGSLLGLAICVLLFTLSEPVQGATNLTGWYTTTFYPSVWNCGQSIQVYLDGSIVEQDRSGHKLQFAYYQYSQSGQKNNSALWTDVQRAYYGETISYVIQHQEWENFDYSNMNQLWLTITDLSTTTRYYVGDIIYNHPAGVLILSSCLLPIQTLRAHAFLTLRVYPTATQPSTETPLAVAGSLTDSNGLGLPNQIISLQGTLLYNQSKQPVAWSDTVKVQTDPNGNYSYIYYPTIKGRYAFKASFAGDNTYDGAWATYGCCNDQNQNVRVLKSTWTTEDTFGLKENLTWRLSH